MEEKTSAESFRNILIGILEAVRETVVEKAKIMKADVDAVTKTLKSYAFLKGTVQQKVKGIVDELSEVRTILKPTHPETLIDKCNSVVAELSEVAGILQRNGTETVAKSAQRASEQSKVIKEFLVIVRGGFDFKNFKTSYLNLTAKEKVVFARATHKLPEDDVNGGMSGVFVRVDPGSTCLRCLGLSFTFRGWGNTCGVCTGKGKCTRPQCSVCAGVKLKDFATKRDKADISFAQCKCAEWKPPGKAKPSKRRSTSSRRESSAGPAQVRLSVIEKQRRRLSSSTLERLRAGQN